MKPYLRNAVIIASILIVSIVGGSFIYQLGYNTAREDNYDNGYHNGYNEGWSKGSSVSYNNGYDLGYEHGNSSGYQNAVNELTPTINQSQYFSKLADAYHYNVSCGPFVFATIYLKNGQTDFSYFRFNNTWDCQLTAYPSELMFIQFHVEPTIAHQPFVRFYHLIQFPNGSIVQDAATIYTLHLDLGGQN